MELLFVLAKTVQEAEALLHVIVYLSSARQYDEV